MATPQALALAQKEGLDLIEINPKAEPPVCKILDFGKFKYEQARKKKNEQKQHHTQIKEIRIRPQSGDADVETKVKHAKEMLAKKDKVLLVVQFRGRELAHTEVGFERLKQIVESLSDCAKVERHPTREGKRISAVLAPK